MAEFKVGDEVAVIALPWPPRLQRVARTTKTLVILDDSTRWSRNGFAHRYGIELADAVLQAAGVDAAELIERARLAKMRTALSDLLFAADALTDRYGADEHGDIKYRARLLLREIEGRASS